MNNKVQRRISGSTREADPVPGKTETIKIVYSSIGRDTIDAANNWGEIIVDVEKVFKTMVQDLMFGKPVIISHDSFDDIDKFISDLKLQMKLYAAEGVAFKRGVAYLSLAKDPAGNIRLALANESFPNRIIYAGDIKVGAEIWEVFETDRAPYYMRTTYTSEKINRYLFDGFGEDKKEVKLAELSKHSVPAALIPPKEEKNKWKFIPVEPIYFRHPENYSDQAIDEISGMSAISGVQNMLNETSYAWRKELHNNATKVLLDEGMLDHYSESELRRLQKADWLLKLEGTGSSDGSGKQIEIMQGNPKLKEYQESFSGILTAAAEALKLSTLGVETGSSSATEAIFTKANDVETTNTLKTMRISTISRILEKAKLMKENTAQNEWEIDETQWIVQINPNIIMNEAKLTDTLIKQHQVGAIDLPSMVSELKGISYEAAVEKLENRNDEFDKETELDAENSTETAKDNDMSDKDITGGE